MPQRKNVMLLIADDWSPIAGCYGHPVIQTPVVDALAKKGVVFEHAYCTTPSCAASRATLLTGLHSHTHGQYGHTHHRHSFRTLPNTPTLPELLHRSGVFTGIIGKQHTLPKDLYPWNFNQGDTNPHAVNHSNSNEIKWAAESFFKASAGQPFYLHIGFSTPHRQGNGFGNETEALSSVSEVYYQPQDVLVPGFLPDTPEVREDLANYYTAISRMDATIGRALESLLESGLAAETFIIIMSDHGMPFPGAKASSFDSGHHCPLIIVDPEARSTGIRNCALLNWTDLMPTLLELFGITPPENLHGRSFLSVLEEEKPEGWDETTFSHNFHGVTECYPYRAIRGRRYKYVLNLFPELTLPLPTDLFASRTWRAVEQRHLDLGARRTADVLHQAGEKFYDLEADPLETTNLIDKLELEQVVTSYREKMRHFRNITDDFWLLATEQAHLREWPS